jgi:hypothetical protein
MTITGEKDCYLKIKIMKRTEVFAATAIAILLLATGCKDSNSKRTGASDYETVTDTSGLLLIGKDIITEVDIKPDTLGDPWAIEKVKGFKGEMMFKMIFDRIHNDKLTVYDCRIDKPLTLADVKGLEKEFNTDLSKIGKAQFTEDWYFDTNKNFIVKKIKSISFGFALEGFADGPFKYKALFRLKN